MKTRAVGACIERTPDIQRMKLSLPKIALLAVALLALNACDQKNDPRPRVLVSNLPTAWLVKQIAGDKVIVQTLAGSGGCGHEFQPTDKEIAEASKAQIWFQANLEFERANWAKKLHTPVVFTPTMREWPPREAPPHYWMSLDQYQHLAAQVAGALPGHQNWLTSPEFRKIESSIAARHAHLTQLLAPLRNQAFLSDHPAYTYFAADYGLKQIPLEEDGHEATDASLVRVIAQAKAANVKVLFLSSEEHRAEAEAVAKAVGAQVVLADPNSENTPELLEMMANMLVKAHGIQAGGLK